MKTDPAGAEIWMLPGIGEWGSMSSPGPNGLRGSRWLPGTIHLQNIAPAQRSGTAASMPRTLRRELGLSHVPPESASVGVRYHTIDNAMLEHSAVVGAKGEGPNMQAVLTRCQEKDA